MSVKKYSKTKNAEKKSGNNKAHPDLSSCLTLLPGLLMCAMLVIVLILDIAMPGMTEKQYEVFPDIFTIADSPEPFVPFIDIYAHNILIPACCYQKFQLCCKDKVSF